MARLWSHSYAGLSPVRQVTTAPSVSALQTVEYLLLSGAPRLDWTVYAGLRVDKLMGNFHLSDPSTPTLGLFDADQAFSVSFSLTAKLSTHQYASIQCAVLYTTADGRRLVRVINLALQVADLASNVFRFADMDIVVAHLMRQCKSIFIMLDRHSDPAYIYQL
jgi:hypothetical protein